MDYSKISGRRFEVINPGREPAHRVKQQKVTTKDLSDSFDKILETEMGGSPIVAQQIRKKLIKKNNS